MANIKVSIVVPVYNTEKYLRQCMESILEQTLREIEVICVDDGSTDGSPGILKEFEEKDSRVRTFLKAKTSIGTARNYGLSKAVGEFIGFVDSDDYIDPHMYERLYQSACSQNAQVAITNIALYHTDTQETYLYRDTRLYERLEKQTVFSARQAPDILQSIGIWDKLYRHDFLIKHGLKYPEYTVFEDHLFSFQALVLAERITLVNQPLYFYRKQLPASITGREIKNDIFKLDFLNISSQIRRFLQSTGTYEVFANEFVIYQFRNALWHQSNISDLKVFREYFSVQRNNISDEEWKLAYRIPDVRIKVYAYALKHNWWAVCYLLNTLKGVIRPHK